MPQLFVVLILGLWFPVTAWAYIDPNTAGMLYQALLPLLVFVVATWRWIKQAVVSFLSTIKHAVMGPGKPNTSEEKAKTEADKKN